MSVFACPPNGTVYLVGDVDMSNLADHERSVSDFILACEGQTVVVNCSRLSFIDAQGLAMMCRLHAIGQTVGLHVVWRGLNAFQYRLLSVTGLAHRLQLDPPQPPHGSRAHGCA
jgi:anti-anti-sigma factor